MKFGLQVFLLLGCLVSPLVAQSSDSSLLVENLRRSVLALSHDSLLGRLPGTAGGEQGADYIAAQFQELGLEPAGVNGSYCQPVPLARVGQNPESNIELENGRLEIGTDFVLVGADGVGVWEFHNLPTVVGGFGDDPSSWIDASEAQGKFVVFFASRNNLRRPINPRAILASDRFSSAAAIGVAGLDVVPAEAKESLMAGRRTVLRSSDTDLPSVLERPVLLLSANAVQLLFEGQLDNLQPRTGGFAASGEASTNFFPLPKTSCNIVGKLRGSDPTLAGQHVVLSAHHDHLGISRRVVDHDSVIAFNEMVRPLGSFSRNRRPTAQEVDLLSNIIESIRARRPSRSDSVFNGANDNASGVAALIEIARSFTTSNPTPSRSLLFVAHTAEEMGLLGSNWFTTNPTIATDSIVATIEIDMIGTAESGWSDDEGPQLLVIGARTMSNELGDLVDSVSHSYRNSIHVSTGIEDQVLWDRLFCLADHFSYARLGIPSIAFSSGPNVHYHQVTDEAFYLDYPHMATVSMLVRDLVRTISNRDQRLIMNESPPDFVTMCGR